MGNSRNRNLPQLAGTMVTITFFDTEIEPNTAKILDIGAIKADGSSFHSSSACDFINFLHGSRYICGHNIFDHDLRYIQDIVKAVGFNNLNCIDTLFLSPLLFPAKPYHALLKDDKLQIEELNNPLNDSIKARDLFFDEVAAFQRLDETLKAIFSLLLQDKKEFCSFFDFVGYKQQNINIQDAIMNRFQSQICEYTSLANLITDSPVELAYCLALINTKSQYSITPPWVLNRYPAVQRVMHRLRTSPCLQGCQYCNAALDVRQGLKRFFGFTSYRSYAGEPLQETVAKAAISNKSLLAVFPTGGGKSIAFQVPALMSGINSRGLTVIISPLQSLMKDQVDNLEKIGITDAVTINGLQDPIERAQSLERVEDGSASLLYISPESLRSKTIERILLRRNVVRFVIDEAHCFSSWGQDFRVDYLYIGDFIKSIQEKKNLGYRIPVSCFTATAKQKVIEDIRNYFKDKLSLDIETYVSNASRTNLSYRVYETARNEDKYVILRGLIEDKKCPTIVYVSRTRAAEDLANRLANDGYKAKPYHGQMDRTIKTENQDAFIKSDIQVMVATSAFGMGVDKKDVGLVIHYDISDSLENYIQESGRAGRDEAIHADCYILFNDEDLSKHFVLLNQTKLSIKEIQQVWRAIKEVTRSRSKASQSALEIARKAGWDDRVSEIETRVRTAIATLEDSGYLKRGQNVPRIFATSILAKNANEAIMRINASPRFDNRQKSLAARIIVNLISNRSIKRVSEAEAEARVDYIADHLGIELSQVIEIVTMLRDEKILADMTDLTAFFRKGENKNRILNLLELYRRIEELLLSVLDDKEKVFNIKKLNEQAEQRGCRNVNPDKIKTILNFLAIKDRISKHNEDYEKNHIAIACLHGREELQKETAQRYELAKFIAEYLIDKSSTNIADELHERENTPVEFSILELKERFEKRQSLLNTVVNSRQVEDALFYLSRIEALSIEGGFMVIYNALSIERIELDNKRQYKAEDYKKLQQFYENKIQQIHIVGEYARKVIDDYKGALQFVDDYFRLNYSLFLNKYFKGSRRDEIVRNMTPAKFEQLFGALSTKQLGIITDNKSQYIVVAAGPGSGKTRILVHKMASLLLMEDIKHEQLLMLTFSRSAATEFQKRLIELIGTAAYYIQIKTFHSYCFDLLGRVGTIEKSDEILREAVDRINSGDVEPERITKTVLVIDEAQDMNADEFSLIKALMEQNPEMRVIAVGDDDQNIFEFRGATSEYLEKLIGEDGATKYELLENYRSSSNLVDFANQFVKRISHRLKVDSVIAVHRENGRIKIVQHRSENLVTPVVNDILSESLPGTLCILTKTNSEASQIAGLLLKNRVQAKLIQSNEGFNLLDLLEVRFFLSQLNLGEDVFSISEDAWYRAKQRLQERFVNNLNLEVCSNLIRDFETTNPKSKYKTDLEIFIRESKLEDFIGNNGETVFVSTIHKAKGREFDNVILILDQFDVGTDEACRQVYVAATRAKRQLVIHYNGNYLDSISTEDLERVVDKKIYSAPSLLAMQLTHKDVWLDYFANLQGSISELNSGDKLDVDLDTCRNSKGSTVVKFSKQFVKQVQVNKQNSYIPKAAEVRYIVYWRSKETQLSEIKIVLPELHFERVGQQV